MITVEIHEFSTGITPQRVGNGWVSNGFTGKWMNATFTDNVPYGIERSIANDEFDVRSGNDDEPAVIGRVIPDPKGGEWSVVAIVSKGQDEHQRSAPFHRYFLCTAVDGLWALLTWIEHYEKQQGHLPVFNPFEVPVQQPYYWTMPDFTRPPLRAETDALIRSQTAPVVVPRDQPDKLRIIQEMAERKANETGQPIAWAVNVEFLKKPQRFLVIYPASDQAYRQIQQAASAVAVSALPVVADEKAIKNAIRDVVANSPAKLGESIAKIAAALQNDKITEKHWQQWFDSQGAKNKVRNEAFTRLFTLRAFILPETLPKHLSWLNIEEDSRNETTEQSVFLEFQGQLFAQLQQYFTKEDIYSQLSLGIEAAFRSLFAQQVTPHALAWLMKRGPAWGVRRGHLIEGIYGDLTQIKQAYLAGSESVNDALMPGQQQHYLQGQSWQSHRSTTRSDPRVDTKTLKYGDIWSDLQRYYRFAASNRLDAKPVYLNFAKFFEKMDQCKLAAYFYQVAQTKVPNRVFKAAFPDEKERGHLSLLGLTLYRDVPLYERAFVVLNELRHAECQNLKQGRISLPSAAALALLMFLAGRIDRNFLKWATSLPGGVMATLRGSAPQETQIHSNQPPSDPNQGDTGRSLVSTASLEDKLIQLIEDYPAPQIPQDQTPQDKIGAALEKYPGTIDTLKFIINDVTQQYASQGVSPRTVKAATKKVLNLPNDFGKGLGLSAVLESNKSLDDATKIQLIDAIYNFQNQKFSGSEPNNVLGYMVTWADADKQVIANTPREIESELKKILDEVLRNQTPVSAPP